MTMFKPEPTKTEEMFDLLLAEAGAHYAKTAITYGVEYDICFGEVLYADVSLFAEEGYISVDLVRSYEQGYTSGRLLFDLLYLLKKMKAFGIEEIKALADREEGLRIGYKVWYKMGFKSDFMEVGTKHMVDTFGVATVEELCSTPEGRKRWAEEGFSYPIKLEL